MIRFDITGAWLLAAGLAVSMVGCGWWANASGQEDESAAAGAGAASRQTDRTTNDRESDSMVKVRVFNEAGELVGPVEAEKIVKSDAQWQAQLTADQYRITRRAGTEPAFCGTLLENKKEGVYACVCCGLPLFSSDSKFKSGTGWPSFFQPIAEENIGEHEDRSYGMVRTEIVCNRCDAHLGHVFNDGPKPTGLRYCLNSESLTFTESDELAKLADPVAAKAEHEEAAE